MTRFPTQNERRPQREEKQQKRPRLHLRRGRNSRSNDDAAFGSGVGNDPAAFGNNKTNKSANPMAFGSKKTYVVEGHVKPGFESAVALFEANFRRGLETNAQLCVYVREECVIDVCGKSRAENEYDRDSLQNVFSSTKSLSAVVFATLVDRGLLDYKDKV